MPELKPAEQQTLDGLVAAYRDGSITAAQRASLIQWLAYRDGLLSKSATECKIRCALNRSGCLEWIAPEKAQVDHKVPRDRRGPTVASNLQAVCEFCNPSKGAGR